MGSPDVIIIGAGVLGLTAAVLLQQRLPFVSITIISSELLAQSPLDSTHKFGMDLPSTSFASAWAGAHYRPIPALTPSNPAYNQLSGAHQAFHSQLANEHRIAVRTAGYMKSIASSNPAAGVKVLQAAEYLESPPPENLCLRSGDLYASPDDGFRVLEQAELDTLNAKACSTGDSKPVKWACEYETYTVNVHTYCQYLLREFLDHGGKTIKQRLNSFADMLACLPSQQAEEAGQCAKAIIVNCSGLGLPSQHDPATKIIRGQTVLVRQQFNKTLTRQCSNGTWSFLIPRPLGGGTIVGGTKQIGDEESNARPEERRQLLANAAKYFPEFVKDAKDFEVVQDNVGRRPWRKGGIRIEIDENALGDSSKGVVVHGYGAGGRGYELSWGTAEQICVLVEKCLSRNEGRIAQEAARLTKL